LANRASRPAGSRAGHATPKADPPARANVGSAPSLITVQCPNPSCGRTYTIRSSCAGKSGRCKCGTLCPIPRAGAARGGTLPSPAGGEPAGDDASLRPKEDVIEVRVSCIGRGHAGKTALLRTLAEGPLGEFFPSGLHVDAGDPREVARMIREAEQTERLLH